MNLVINSIEAMKDVDGVRELIIKSQRAENEQILVSVSDTGIGFPPQLAEQIFDPFFTTKLHGTGMGLRISRSIIESHGGRLWASGSSGRGATLQFTLPSERHHHTRRGFSVTSAVRRLLIWMSSCPLLRQEILLYPVQGRDRDPTTKEQGVVDRASPR